MRVRIVLAEKEPIALALGRFRQLLDRHGTLWEMGWRRHFIRLTEIRRAKRFQKRFKARVATFLAKRVGKQPGIPELAAFWKRSGKP